MRKLPYLLLLLLFMMSSSCTMVIKGLAKGVASHYDDHQDINISNLKLQDENVKQENFETLFYGKTVYIYAWTKDLPPGDENTNYAGLKERFAKYNDVVFINIYTGSNENDWERILKMKNHGVKAYRLSSSPDNNPWKKLTQYNTNPEIIGSTGLILGYNGPRPSDNLVVDYALDQARKGINATIATRKLIKEINGNVKFKNKELASWYENHFEKKPDGKLNISISSEN